MQHIGINSLLGIIILSNVVISVLFCPNSVKVIVPSSHHESDEPLLLVIETVHPAINRISNAVSIVLFICSNLCAEYY